MTTLPEEAVRAAAKCYLERAVSINETASSLANAMLTAALPHLPQGVGVNSAKIEAARKAVEELAYTPMNLPLEDWSRISSTILSALEPSVADCPCTLIQQDETCPVGYPSLLCEICDGKGVLQPSAARELALEERLQAIEQQLVVNLGYFHDEKRILLETLQSHIVSHISAIRALSSPDHADAGKVEGDDTKWSMREVVAKAIAYHAVGDPHARTIRGDQRWEWFTEEADKFISVFGYYLPSAPSQEVAGS